MLKHAAYCRLPMFTPMLLLFRSKVKVHRGIKSFSMKVDETVRNTDEVPHKHILT